MIWPVGAEGGLESAAKNDAQRLAQYLIVGRAGAGQEIRAIPFPADVRARKCPVSARPGQFRRSSMKPTERQAQIIRKLGLQGTLIEQLVMKPGVLTNPERYVDSPSLMRFAMDVRRALSAEGWEPPEPQKAARERGFTPRP